MRIFKKILKYTFFFILFILVAVVSITCVLYFSANMKQPEISTEVILPSIDEIGEYPNNYRQYGKNYFRQSETGLWEMKVEGGAFERGLIIGALTDYLLYFQEKVFVDQIKEMIPSESYLKFLRFFLLIFNRNLGDYVVEEYRNEIYGIAQSCTHEFDMIGTPYERQLNYHAAHDIGHALQDLMLVGCSSFACWDDESEDSTLIVGRNFDFYMGDDFAKNKVVMFIAPDEGYKFASVSWAGMMGVTSGMNEKGLTATINAAKSSIPSSAATPISLLIREIIQYASTIEEAYHIAEKRKTFVSESILIGSAIDGKAAIIEKSPDKTALFTTDGKRIICTNHFQSDTFKNDERNIENIQTSDSYYRYERLAELLENNTPLNQQKTADILRNRLGKNNEELGLSNEMAINQFIAHHSVIFKPEKLQMWVSTSPWQSGKYVMYDLEKIFSDSVDFSDELYDADFTLQPDSFIYSAGYTQLKDYRRLNKYIKNQIKQSGNILADSIFKFEATNPDYYYMLETTGDYYASINEKMKAEQKWQEALMKKIPRTSDKTRIENKIKKLHEK